MLSISSLPPSPIPELHQSHAHLIKTGLIRHPSFSSLSLSLSLSLSSSSFAWNTLIRAHAASADPKPALLLFLRMLLSPARPDNFTFPFLLKACTSLLALGEASQIHTHILKLGFSADIFIQNSLVHFYAAAGRTGDAYKIFDRMPVKDAVTWNAILSVYVANGQIGLARALFDGMTERSVETWNFMISGYVNAGLLDDAFEMFDRMPNRDVVSWNAAITGYVRGGRSADAIELFQEMLSKDVRPDECTLVNVLTSCARSGALGQGEWVHAYIDRNGVKIGGFLATALVDMYSKCGCIDRALQVFNDTPRKDVSTWNAIIEGLSSHGYEEDALRIFGRMSREGFIPNAVTFVIVLSACSHSGLLDEGRQIFSLMVTHYGIEPMIEHYGCMVDLFGRAGLLEEAEGIIRRVAVKDATVLWESLLSACRNCGDVGLAEMVAKRILKLASGYDSCYVQLSNVYALAGRWDDVREVREIMRVKGVRKEPGCSTIEVNGVVHEFFVGD